MRAHKMKQLIKNLEFALTLKRPHRGNGEKALLQYIADNCGFPSETDPAGNLHIDNTQGGARTLFIAHVDTVHREDGVNIINKAAGKYYAGINAPLGADDGAGVALLMHLLAHDVGGYYIFSVGEEVGGIGARYISQDPYFLQYFDRAIAFDRRGTSDVITHQGFGRCCSDEFADALSDALNNQGLLYMPSDGGVYTDTAEFIDVIPECTNISVGYLNEHRNTETLDLRHYLDLADAIIAIDWESLPIVRDVNIYEDESDDLPHWVLNDYEMGAKWH